MRAVALVVVWIGVGCFQPAKVQPEVSDTAESDGEIAAATCVESGAVCDDGDPCTREDRCDAGRCVGTPKVCEAPAACREAGVCHGATGECTYAVSQDSTPCDDGDRCSAGDRCVSGVCEPTRAPDDSISDFAFVYGGRGGHRVAAVAATKSEIWALVEFPAVEVEDPVLELDLPNGSTSSVHLPAGSAHMLVLVRHSWRGEVQGHEVIVTSASELSGSSLSVSDDGSFLASGRFVGSATLWASGDEVLETSQSTPVLFAMRHRAGVGHLPAWVLENDSQESFARFDAFLHAGEVCVVLANVEGTKAARLARERTVIGTLGTGPTKAAATHLAWLPGCGSTMTIRRELHTSDNIFLGTLLSRGAADGRVAVAGMSGGQVSLVRDGGAAPLLEASSLQAFAVVLDATGDVVQAMTATDPAAISSGFHAPMGLALAPRRVGFAFPVSRQGAFEVDRVVRPTVDNPQGSEDHYPRAVLAVADEDGVVAMMAEPAEKASVFAALTVDGRRVWGVGMTDDDTFGGLDPITMNPGPAGGGIVATAYEGVGRAYAHNLCVSDGSTPVSDPSLGLHLVRLPGTASVVIGGTLTGSCTLGSARTKDVTVVEPTGFLTRINSGDGLGCGP